MYSFVIGCNQSVESNSTNWNFESIRYQNELYLIQTDDRFGEWGGNTYLIKVYRENQTEQILLDFKEYQGKAGPPQPPHPDSIPNTILEWFEREPVLNKKSRITVIPTKGRNLIALRLVIAVAGRNLLANRFLTYIRNDLYCVERRGVESSAANPIKQQGRRHIDPKAPIAKTLAEADRLATALSRLGLGMGRYVAGNKGRLNHFP